MAVAQHLHHIAAAEFAVALGKGEDIVSGNGKYKAEDTFYDGTYDIPYYKIDPIAVTAENMDQVIIDGGFHTREDVYLNMPEAGTEEMEQ